MSLVGVKAWSPDGAGFASSFYLKENDDLDRILGHRGISINAGGYFEVKKDNLTSVS